MACQMIRCKAGKELFRGVGGSVFSVPRQSHGECQKYVLHREVLMDRAGVKYLPKITANFNL